MWSKICKEMGNRFEGKKICNFIWGGYEGLTLNMTLIHGREECERWRLPVWWKSSLVRGNGLWKDNNVWGSGRDQRGSRTMGRRVVMVMVKWLNCALTQRVALGFQDHRTWCKCLPGLMRQRKGTRSKKEPSSCYIHVDWDGVLHTAELNKH